MIGLLLKNCFFSIFNICLPRKKYRHHGRISTITVSHARLCQRCRALAKLLTFAGKKKIWEKNFFHAFEKSGFVRAWQRACSPELPSGYARGVRNETQPPPPWWMINPIIWTCKKVHFVNLWKYLPPPLSYRRPRFLTVSKIKS